MNFPTAVKTCFTNFANFKDRASRSEFWWFFLFGILVSIVAGVIDAVAFGIVTGQSGPVATVVSLALLVPNLSVTARRLHDINRSGWWMLLVLTIVGILLLLFWYCQKSDEGDNRFGPNPMR